MSKGNLGMGVMIRMLSGNEETVKAYKAAIGKKIKKCFLKDDALHIHFVDGSGIRLSDEGQSCCESRYMSTDDDLAYYKNTKLVKIEIKTAPNMPDEYGEHEVQFLEVTTGKGSFQMANHNEHNGYYGGFWITIKEESAT